MISSRPDKRYLDVAKIDEALYEAKGDTKFLDNMIAIYYYSNDFDKIIELLKKYDYKPSYDSGYQSTVFF